MGRMKEGAWVGDVFFRLLLYGFVVFFISFTEKKRSKESRPDDLLNPACASAKGRVLLRFVLFRCTFRRS